MRKTLYQKGTPVILEGSPKFVRRWEARVTRPKQEEG